MNKKGILFLLMWGMMCGVAPEAWSQTVISEMPYWCDFEDAITEWTLVNGSEANYWVRGNATSCSSWGYGSKSLYITNNGSSNAYAGDNGVFNAVFAYVVLDLEAGQYELQFDWKCNGEADGDFLRVALVPDATSVVAGD